MQPVGPAPTFGHSPAHRGGGMPVWGRVVIGCGSVSLFAVILICGGLVALTGGNEGGTRYSNNMESYALEYLAEHSVLEPGEQLVAYYDATLSLDGSEAAIVTDRRLIYHHQGRDTSLPLADIERVDHEEEALIGTVIRAYGRDGTLMLIEVAPFNDGQGFLSALEDQRSMAPPSEE